MIEGKRTNCLSGISGTGKTDRCADEQNNTFDPDRCKMYLAIDRAGLVCLASGTLIGKTHPGGNPR
ncbi:hypothetical protein [Paracoccus sp. SCSIO 75233]|uniref:hypothetical protein n=1 Tax=Paracoccus sp. SCSIO 75233 TaxID=3017782 RepID=UPI0022F1027A|nr:hypothetical protein [Paracoccus sp. SCSIO 75233]WBU54137.1 hypothetical protein PAF12_04700 [Paracoccus sp. SCSIO 75233]